MPLFTLEAAPHGGAVLIRGSEGMAVQFAKCCKPIPGDPIIGWLTKGRGVSVHRASCANLKRLDPAVTVAVVEPDPTYARASTPRPAWPSARLRASNSL